MSSGGPERIVEPEEILQGGAQICPGGLAGYLPGHGATVGGHDSGDALLIGVLRAGGHVAHYGTTGIRVCRARWAMPMTTLPRRL